MQIQIFEKLKIEFLGSFFLCLAINFLGVQYSLNTIDNIGYSVSVFIVVCFLLWNGKFISDCQYNPLITLSLMFTGHVKVIQGILIMFIQVFGAIFAAAILKVTVPDNLFNQI